MNSPNIYLRQGNIVFSREFVDILRSKEITLTRRNNFTRSCIIINHGNSKPYSIGRNVSKLYFLNHPDAIHYCCNKKHNWNILKDFYPNVYSNSELNGDINFPIIAKPLNGHHGYGIVVVKDRKQLDSISNKNSYIFQDLIPIKHEFRFNVLDRDVFQISHRQRLDEETDEGGYVFSYRSLGNDAKISGKFRNYVLDVIKKFHEVVGYSVADYCVDVMKGTDNEYYLSEINSAYGIGQYTIEKLVDSINYKYDEGKLEQYRVGT